MTSRMARFCSSNIELNPYDDKWLEEVKVKHWQELDHRGVFSFNWGGFSNVVQCFDGTVVATNDHDLDFGFGDVLKDEVHIIPDYHKVIQVDCASNDIIYISPKNIHESYGEVYFLKKHDSNSLSSPQHVRLPELSKYVAASQTHMFAVTLTNKVYAWMPYVQDFEPFLVKGLLNDDVEYDEKGNVINNTETTKESTDDLDQVINRPADYEETKHTETLQTEASKKKWIKKMVCGNVFGLVLYETGELFYLKFNEESKDQIISRPARGLFNKNIVDIEASFVHCIALEKEIIQPITEWDSAKTSQWFEEIGFDDWANLAQHHNINGKTIVEADTDYLEDVLGIYDIPKQQKLVYEISLKRETTFSNINLYGWGSNIYGQLGISVSIHYSKH